MSINLFLLYRLKTVASGPSLMISVVKERALEALGAERWVGQVQGEALVMI